MNNIKMIVIVISGLFGCVDIALGMDGESKETLVAIVEGSLIRKCFPTLPVKEPVAEVKKTRDEDAKHEAALYKAILSAAHHGRNTDFDSKVSQELVYKSLDPSKSRSGFRSFSKPIDQKKPLAENSQHEGNCTVIMQQEPPQLKIQLNNQKEIELSNVDLDAFEATLQFLNMFSIDKKPSRFPYYITKKDGDSAEYNLYKVNEFVFEAKDRILTVKERFNCRDSAIDSAFDIGYQDCYLELEHEEAIVHCGVRLIQLYAFDREKVIQLLKDNKQFILEVDRGETVIKMLVTRGSWYKSSWQITPYGARRLDHVENDITVVTATANPENAPVTQPNLLFTGFKYTAVVAMLAAIAMYCRNYFS